MSYVMSVGLLLAVRQSRKHNIVVVRQSHCPPAVGSTSAQEVITEVCRQFCHSFACKQGFQLFSRVFCPASVAAPTILKNNHLKHRINGRVHHDFKTPKDPFLTSRKQWNNNQIAEKESVRAYWRCVTSF